MERRQVLKGLAAGVAVGLSAPNIVRAQTTVLTMSSWLPPQSLLYDNLINVWREDIARLTAGRLSIELLEKPLGPPPAHLGLLQESKCDIAYTLHGYTPDRFLRARVGQFSFLGDSFSVSQAFSKVYNDTLNAPEEHPGIEILGLFQHGPGVLMLKDRKIRSAKDFEGLRVRTSGGYIGSVLEDLGAINKPMSPFAVAEALASNEIDGVAFPYEAAPAFKVTDQINYVSEVPGGYYNASWFLGMSAGGVAKVSQQDLKILRDYSRSTIHVLAAKAFDFADYLAKEEIVARGIEVEPANDEVLSTLRQASLRYEQEWDAQLKATGYDGAYALQQTRELTGQS
ncbi:MAG: ABC transporter substrate-binding protein [Pseudomonadota bacterium]